MHKLIAIALLAALPARVLAGDAFEQASSIAYEIIGAEFESPLCRPPPASDARRQALVIALESVKTAELSDEVGLTPLHYAVVANDVPGMQRLIEMGYRRDTRDIHGSTLLHAAALVGSVDALSFLLAQGADPNVRSRAGGTPLMDAASQNRPQLVWLLISAGASAALRTDAGFSALHYALQCKNPEVIGVLLDAGAPIDAKAKALSAKFGIELSAKER